MCKRIFIGNGKIYSTDEIWKRSNIAARDKDVLLPIAFFYTAGNVLGLFSMRNTPLTNSID